MREILFRGKRDTNGTTGARDMRKDSKEGRRLDMKTREELIAEMAVIGCVRNPQAHTMKECFECGGKYGSSCNAYRHAEKLHNAGYRKQSDTAREILQYLYEKMGNVSLSDTELVLYLAAQYGVEVKE